MVSGPDSKTPAFLTMYGKACYLARDDQKAIPIYKQLAADVAAKCGGVQHAV
jgi:hypothetical protein